MLDMNCLTDVLGDNVDDGTQMDPKFLRNLRYAKRHNKKEEK